MSLPELEPLDTILVLPVYNEALILERSVRTVHALLTKIFPAPWRLIIAENGSTDGTAAIAERLAAELPNVVVLQTTAASKGEAIRFAWQSLQAERYFFSDVDLSVDLSTALPAMLASFAQGADVVTGARSLKNSVVHRPAYRRFVSWGYAQIAHLITGTRLHDLPCGCKGVTRRVIDELLSQIRSNSWFFDSELLLLAEAKGYKIAEVPVHWTEYRYPERRRSISIPRIARQYVAALWQIRRRLHH